jgi:N-acetyl-anhydromuramyl-L-alanine amidase AmpD
MRLIRPLLLLAACSPALSLDGTDRPAWTPDASEDPGDGGGQPGEGDPNQATEFESGAGAAAAYTGAAMEYGVPIQILAALADIHGQHQMVDGEVEFEGYPQTIGALGMPARFLGEATDLAGLSWSEAEEMEGHLTASAALLRAWADEAGIARDAGLAVWAPVVARWSDLPNEEGQSWYVAEVYGQIAKGSALEGEEVKGVRVVPEFPAPHNDVAPMGDRGYAVWRPSPNYSARPAGSGGKPAMVIVHTCEGAYSGCHGWLRNRASGVSTHYVVNSDGSEVSQLVRDSQKAWHISADYACSRNGGVDCFRDGASANNFTIGVEHAGYGSQNSWHPGLIETSAQLACDVTQAHGIPRDRYHLVAHGQLQPWNRSDPGAAWPWSSYIEQVQRACGDVRGSDPDPAPSVRVIDSNNARNNTARERLSVSGAWTSSVSVRGYHGTGYWWRTTSAAAEDAALFQFQADERSCLLVEAWWSSASDRSEDATFVMSDAAGVAVGRSVVDQRRAGGAWNSLGSFWFTRGWNTVALSRLTGARGGGGVVVADGVRLSPSSACDAGNGPLSIVVDSDDSNNGPDAEVWYGSAWTSARSTAGYHGSDYVWADTGVSADPMDFVFQLDRPRRVRLEAWWTAGSNRSAEAPFLVVDAGGATVATVRVDQRVSHATWVSLGVFDLPAGWNRVSLSRQAPRGAVVVGDAIRVTDAR